MPLYKQVGVGPGDIVLDGDPAPPKGAQPPSNFRSMIIVPTTACIRIPLGTEVGLSVGDIVLDGDSAPSPKRGTADTPPLFGPCPLWPNGWMN